MKMKGYAALAVFFGLGILGGYLSGLAAGGILSLFVPADLSMWSVAAQVAAVFAYYVVCASAVGFGALYTLRGLVKALEWMSERKAIPAS